MLDRQKDCDGDVNNPFLGKCPNCEYEMLINPANKLLTHITQSERVLIQFVRSLSPFSETPIKIIKHDGQIRLEVEKTVEKIVL